MGPSNIKASALEASILEQIAQDIQSPAFSAQLVDNARRAQMPSDGVELDDLVRQMKEIDVALARLRALIEQTDTPAPILSRIEAREAERGDLAERLERLEEATRQANEESGTGPV